MLASEFYDEPEKYGRSPRNRVSEARSRGALISGKWESKTDFRYVLLREPERSSPEPSKLSSAKRSKEFFAGQRATGLPLFDAAVRP